MSGADDCKVLTLSCQVQVKGLLADVHGIAEASLLQ